jgi:hypothetical protein
VIVWLNGPFGAGKTTLGAKLREQLPDSLIFDPEEIGFVMRTIVPPAPSGDFQDLPIWRHLTLAALLGLRRFYPQTIIVPMTLVQPAYLEEIFGGLNDRGERLLHVFLGIDASLLRSRIKAQVMVPDPIRDQEIREWRLDQVERCLASQQYMPAGTRSVDSGADSPDVLAERIVTWMKA